MTRSDKPETGLPSGGKSTGFYHPEKINGIWWWVDPDGKLFLSKGVNHVLYNGDGAESEGYGRTVLHKYPRREDWARDALARLREWGFNTIGCWSDDALLRHAMPTVETLSIGTRAGGEWRTGVFPDVFADRFPQEAEKAAREKCAPRKDDRGLLGYFTDNELRWVVDIRSDQSMLAAFWTLSPDAPGKKEIARFLSERYGSIQAFNQAWDTRFTDFEALLRLPDMDAVGESLRRVRWISLQQSLLVFWGSRPARIRHYLTRWYKTVEVLNRKWGVNLSSFDQAMEPSPLSPQAKELIALESDFLRRVAVRYFKVCADAIRRHDPNHAILGCRYNANAAKEVAESMGDCVDVISFNDYSYVPPEDKIGRLNELSGKPLMLTEFSFKAKDAGLGFVGAGEPVETQQDRADRYAEYVTELMSLPYMIGFHWFQYADQPAAGRKGDGECSNYGLVDGNDQPWKILTDRMREVNARLEAVHRRPDPSRVRPKLGAEGIGLEM